MSGNINAILDKKKMVLERVQGLGMDQRPIYAYVVMQQSKLPEFRKALAENNVTLQDYGVVVAHGYGEEVPAGLDEQVLKAIETQ